MAKIHAYQQLEHSDCGLTCIRIIADYWGKCISLQNLRKLCDMSRSGISIKELTSGLDKVGIHSIPLNLHRQEVRNMPLPAIIYWNQNHFVVLYKISKNGDVFFVADPAHGKVKVPAQDFFHNWCSGNERGIVILAEPADDFKPELDKDHRLYKLAHTVKESIKRHVWKFVAILFLTIIGLLADVTIPLMIQHTVDEGIKKSDISLVWILAISQLCIFSGYYLTSSVSEYIMTRLGLHMGMEMLDRYLSKLIHLPMDFFERKVKADLIQKTEDQNRIKNFMLTTPQSLLLTFISLVVFSGLLIYYSIFIFSVFITLTLAGLLWSLAFIRKRKSIDHSLNACNSENRNNLYELIHGMPEIKSNNAEAIRVQRWRELQEKNNKLSVKSFFVKFYIDCGQSFFSKLRDIVLTGLCATLVINGEITLGGMITVSYIVGRLAQPFSSLIASIFSIQDASISYERVDEILNSPDKPQNLLTNFQIGNIKLVDIIFKYPGASSPNVLKGINLEIKRGDTIAFVGPSGCGKSTLMKIILGLFKPNDGDIRIGNNSLTDIDSAAWLRHCAIVMQSGTVFSGTVAENIGLCDENPDMDLVTEAATVACIDKFIRSLPMGYNTKLGVAGVELSGGQRQRLLIARAVYKAPEFILLDEATSSLDAHNESKIVRNIQEFKGARTLLVAAHRLSTIRHADIIHYIDGGCIVESGSHEQLMALDGRYARLIAGQLSSPNVITCFDEEL